MRETFMSVIGSRLLGMWHYSVCSHCAYADACDMFCPCPCLPCRGRNAILEDRMRFRKRGSL